LATQATYLRLAGNADGADTVLGKLRALADADDRTVAKGLLLNERPGDAIDRLGRKPEHRAVVFDLLAAQLRYREALALADRTDGDADQRPAVTLRQARVLYLVGETDRAGQLFAKLADGPKTANDAAAA